MRIPYSTLLLLLLAIACNTGNNNTTEINAGDTVRGDSLVSTSDNIPFERETVNSRPVKSYSETIKTFARDDEFQVKLYETKRTFKYLLKISYKQLEVMDTLRVPNFGIQPNVEIKKGDSVRPSCIVGFLDKEKKFRESKLIYFQGNKLRVRVLRYYAVYQSDN